MPITINGSGTVTGISAGGLPDDSIIAADIAAGAVTTAKIADANITAAKLDGAQSGSAPIYAARAWVNFNGTSTVAIRASGNVSSITDNGVGLYTVNFTTAMPDANYAVTGCGRDGVNGQTVVGLRYNVTPTTSACAINTSQGAGTFADFDYANIAIFR